MTGAIKAAAPVTGDTAIASLWDQREYSDITIKFSGKTIFCHKIVLCRFSEYFKKQCGPGSRFAEASLKEIELKDDDPEALEALLEYLYQIEYDSSHDKSWRFYLALGTAADKYLLLALKDEAFQRLEYVISNLKKTPELVAVLQVLDSDYKQDARMTRIRNNIHIDNLDELLECFNYRTYLKEHPKLLWRDLCYSRHQLGMVKKELAAAKLAPPGMEELTGYVCVSHETALASGSAFYDTAGPDTGCAFRGNCQRDHTGVVPTRSVRFYIPES
nr:hypothetical protein B0A51_15854 [Rachicladosporium sp. CCFEE 5018]